jgi:hypothetical protein
VTSGAWTLEPNAEREILLPWLDREPSSATRAKVLSFLASLLLDPDRSHLEGETGVYSIAVVPGTDVGLTWVLNPETCEIVLAHVG